MSPLAGMPVVWVATWLARSSPPSDASSPSFFFPNFLNMARKAFDGSKRRSENGQLRPSSLSSLERCLLCFRSQLNDERRQTRLAAGVWEEGRGARGRSDATATNQRDKVAHFVRCWLAARRRDAAARGTTWKTFGRQLGTSRSRFLRYGVGRIENGFLDRGQRLSKLRHRFFCVQCM